VGGKSGNISHFTKKGSYGLGSHSRDGKKSAFRGGRLLGSENLIDLPIEALNFLL
jgi:hypothetical protein